MDTLARALLAFVRPEQSGPLPAHGIREPLAQDDLEMRERRLCFQSVRLGGIEPELYSVYQAAKAIAVGCCNITLADLASPELVTDEAFHLITGALLMAKYGDAVLNLEKGVNET